MRNLSLPAAVAAFFFSGRLKNSLLPFYGPISSCPWFLSVPSGRRPRNTIGSLFIPPARVVLETIPGVGTDAAGGQRGVRTRVALVGAVVVCADGLFSRVARVVGVALGLALLVPLGGSAPFGGRTPSRRGALASAG